MSLQNLPITLFSKISSGAVFNYIHLPVLYISTEAQTVNNVNNVFVRRRAVHLSYIPVQLVMEVFIVAGFRFGFSKV
jgi:hypothetical protein